MLRKKTLSDYLYRLAMWLKDRSYKRSPILRAFARDVKVEPKFTVQYDGHIIRIYTEDGATYFLTVPVRALLAWVYSNTDTPYIRSTVRVYEQEPERVPKEMVSAYATKHRYRWVQVELPKQSAYVS